MSLSGVYLSFLPRTLAVEEEWYGIRVLVHESRLAERRRFTTWSNACRRKSAGFQIGFLFGIHRMVENSREDARRQERNTSPSTGPDQTCDFVILRRRSPRIQWYGMRRGSWVLLEGSGSCRRCAWKPCRCHGQREEHWKGTGNEGDGTSIPKTICKRRM